MVSFTNELWPSLMYFSIEKKFINNTVVRRNPFYTVIFFVAFVYVSNFLLHKIFSAYLLVNIRDTEKLDERGLTINDRECLHLAFTSNMVRIYSPRDENSFRGRLWKLTESSIFQIIIMILIFMNTALYAILWNNMNISILTYINYAKMGFTGIFIIEISLKIIAYYDVIFLMFF
uniref:Voltage-dependent calcium channel type A subunit alpha-1 (Trinotate prediction) n=1 Tax=Henneguya salminicola TaxID=69463 RepID=A0A6G3MJ23_HENSL